MKKKTKTIKDLFVREFKDSLVASAAKIDTSVFSKTTDLQKIIRVVHANVIKNLPEHEFNFFPWHRGMDLPNHITKVIVHESVTEIDHVTFANFYNLREVVLPNTLVRIGSEAFLNCFSLEQINLPGSLLEIDESAFFGCTSLTEIEIPTGVTVLEDSIFANCISLIRLRFHSRLIEIRDHAFSCCCSLRIVELYEGLVSLGDGTFQNCQSMVACKIPTSLQTIGSKAFANCDELVVIAIPFGCKQISLDAFEDCHILKKAAFESKQRDMVPFLRYRLNDFPLHMVLYKHDHSMADNSQLLSDLKRALKRNKNSATLTDQFGMTPLHFLALLSHCPVEVAAWLLAQHKGALYIQDTLGRLPLHLAIFTCHSHEAENKPGISLIEYLLNKDETCASITTKAEEQSTIVESDIGRPRFLFSLNSSDVSVEKVTKRRNALHYALEYRAPTPVVGKILNFDVNNTVLLERHFDDSLPFHYACKNDLPSDIIKLLLSRDTHNVALNEMDGFEYYQHDKAETFAGISKVLDIAIEAESYNLVDVLFIGSNSTLFKRIALERVHIPVVRQWLTRVSSHRVIIFYLMLQLYCHVASVALFAFESEIHTEIFNGREEDGKFVVNSNFMIRFCILIFTQFVFLTLEIRQIQRLYSNNNIGAYFEDAWNYLELTTIVLVVVSLLHMMDFRLTDTRFDLAWLLLTTGFFQVLAFVSFLRKFMLPFSIFMRGMIKVVRELIPFLIVVCILQFFFIFAYYVTDHQYTNYQGNFTSFEDSFQTTALYLWNGPGEQTSFLDLVYGFFIFIILLNGVVLAIADQIWESATSDSSKVFWGYRIDHLIDFTRKSKTTWQYTDAIENLRSAWFSDDEGMFTKCCLGLSYSVLFISGWFTCGLTWPLTIRMLLFGGKGVQKSHLGRELQMRQKMITQERIENMQKTMEEMAAQQTQILNLLLSNGTVKVNANVGATFSNDGTDSSDYNC